MQECLTSRAGSLEFLCLCIKDGKPLEVPAPGGVKHGLERNDRLVEGLELPVLGDSREPSDIVSVSVLFLTSELAQREVSDGMLWSCCRDPDIRGPSEREASDMVSISVLSHLPLAVVARFGSARWNSGSRGKRPHHSRSCNSCSVCLPFVCPIATVTPVCCTCEAIRRTCSLMVFDTAEALLLTIWA